MIRSKNLENKIRKKIERCRKLIAAEIDVKFSEKPQNVSSES